MESKIISDQIGSIRLHTIVSESQIRALKTLFNGVATLLEKLNEDKLSFEDYKILDDFHDSKEKIDAI